MPMDRVMVLNAKLTISHWPSSLITRQCALVDSKLLHTPRNVGNYHILDGQEAFEKCWAHSPLREAARPFTRCRYQYCRTLPAHWSPRRQRQRVTEGTAMAPWNGPNNAQTPHGWLVVYILYSQLCNKYSDKSNLWSLGLGLTVASSAAGAISSSPSSTTLSIAVHGEFYLLSP